MEETNINIENSEKPILLGFASQKGGVGKSTLAEIIASILYYDKGYNILVVDCDTTQDSFTRLRERDKDFTKLNEVGYKFFLDYFSNKIKRKAYPILNSSADKALEKMNETIKSFRQKNANSESLDFVIFDLAGTANDEDSLRLSLELDYLISPVEEDYQSLVSSLSYINTLKQISPTSPSYNLKDIFVIWNKIDRRIRHDVLDFFNTQMINNNIKVFANKLYYTPRFSRELSSFGLKQVFRSTFISPAKNMRQGSGIDEVVNELLELLNK